MTRNLLTLSVTRLVIILVTAGIPGVADASVIAYEGFQYDAGTNLNALNGGTGFSDAWFVNQSTYTVANGSLGDPTSTLSSSGNSLYHTGLQPQARRNLNVSLGTTGTTIYCSFLLRQDTIGDFTQDNHDFGGLILGGVNQPDIFGLSGLYIGRGAFGALSDKYVLGSAGNASSEIGSGVPAVIGNTALLVIRLDFFADADKVALYVNPSPGSPEPPAGTEFTGIDLGAFTQLAITHGNNSAWMTDEIRIATTWSEVTVPESSSIILLCAEAVSVLVYALRRKALHHC